MDLPVCLVVGAPDDMPRQGTLFSNLLFDHQPNVHVVKQDELFAAFQVGLHRLVLIHGARQAVGQEAGEGQVSPVRALCSAMNCRATVTSTSSRPYMQCVGLDRSSMFSHTRRPGGRSTT